MADRLEKEKRKFFTLKKAFKKKSSKRTIRKQVKNSKRRVRRKQNKVKYYKTLNQIRFQRSTEDLCSQVKVFDIGQMDWAPTKCSSNLPTEVVEWHKQDQIAYWKSRAVSLELENRMLKQHLRNVYAQTIEDCSNKLENINEPVEEKRESSTNAITSKTDDKESQKVEVIPNVPDPDFKNRLEELRKIYGNKAEKIMGMETAIQLNYERHTEQHNPIFWPGIPFKLSFD